MLVGTIGWRESELLSPSIYFKNVFSGPGPELFWTGYDAKRDKEYNNSGLPILVWERTRERMVELTENIYSE